MKHLTILFLVCSCLLGADNWKFVKEQGGLKYFANAEITVITLGNEKVAQIQSKTVFPQGGTNLVNQYWRKRDNHWESAMKTNYLYRANGSLRSHQDVNDLKLAWTVSDSPTDEIWASILNKAAALLQSSK